MNRSSVSALAAPGMATNPVAEPEAPVPSPYPEGQPSRAVELAWLDANEGELAQHYAGQWIAVDGAELVAIAPDLLELLQIASDKGHPHPFVTALPTDPEKELFF